MITKKKKELIVVGKFGKTKGLQGDIYIQSYLSNKFDLLNYNKLFTENKIVVHISIEKKNEKLLAKIQNVSDLNEAKKFIGKNIFIRSCDLPKLKIKNQYYFNELESMTVFLEKKKIGIVTKINNHGAGDYLEIKTNNNDLLVPFNKNHILRIDKEERNIHLNPEYYEL